MNVLVTGATGFVGGAIARKLIMQGATVRVLVRDPQRLGPGLESAIVYLGDLGDPKKIAMAAQGSEGVIHAASEVLLRSDEEVLKWVNVAGTENVINAARYAGCRRMVYISCADVTLANCDRLNWNEDQRPDRPLLNGHARSKQLAEELALSASCAAMEVTALRPAWIWGAGDTSLLPDVCHEALAHGGMRLCGSGRNYFATSHIDVLAEAACGALKSAHAASRAYYVADLTQSTAIEFFSALCSAAGLPRPLKSHALLARTRAYLHRSSGNDVLVPSEVIKRSRHSLFDVQRAVKDLGITPVQSLEPGMERLKRWIADNGGPSHVAGMRRVPKTASSVKAQRRMAERENMLSGEPIIER
ncbi:MAG: NAD-dependent epimerase/dehydratase family protein [Myxococcales bacterium]|nr:NAD-dependent epimerase/dehydratase family protein [Myxococcales bacterium]MCB9707897.1 NAD-dependent epimerase/dehydratase family protein [Myxococcales bacterium]